MSGDTYNGVPVPWIAIWEQEMTRPRLEVTAKGIVPISKSNVVRTYGMWMLRSRTDRRGKPDFGSTHSARQRKAMELQLCQVCGRSSSESGHRHLWVIPNAESHPALWREHLALNAPVCPPCYELANTVCPHLQAVPPFAVCTGTSTPEFITGDMWFQGRWTFGMLPLYAPETQFMIGRELIVRVTPDE